MWGTCGEVHPIYLSSPRWHSLCRDLTQQCLWHVSVVSVSCYATGELEGFIVLGKITLDKRRGQQWNIKKKLILAYIYMPNFKMLSKFATYSSKYSFNTYQLCWSSNDHTCMNMLKHSFIDMDTYNKNNSKNFHQASPIIR